MQHGTFLHAPPRSNKLAARPAHPPSCARACLPSPRAGGRCDCRVPGRPCRPRRRGPPGENGKIAFAGARDGNFEIYVVDPDATGSARLTNDPATDTDPAWSPEGRRITFTTTRNGNDDIYLMSADGTGQVQLTSSPGRDSNSTWSPGGRNIAFASTRDGDAEIFVMNEDGSGSVAAHEQRRPGRDTGVVTGRHAHRVPRASATGTARSTSCESTARTPSASRRARART